jgi:hypothetical protein
MTAQELMDVLKTVDPTTQIRISSTKEFSRKDFNEFNISGTSKGNFCLFIQQGNKLI